MEIKFLDLAKINAPYKVQMMQQTEAFIDKGWYILGDQVKAFEHEFAQYIGVKNALGVANGLDALRMKLLALRIDCVATLQHVHIGCV